MEIKETKLGFKPSLGLFDATMIVAGSMVGSGIFIVGSLMVQDVGSAGWLIAAWVLTALITISAALSCIELTALYPKAGGMYVYLKEAYNPLVAFLYGWSFFSVIQTGMIAAVAIAFSKFAAFIFPVFSEDHVLADLGILQISASKLLAISSIVLLTYINTKGIELGKIIQNFFTVTKLLTLLGLIVFGFLLAFDQKVWDDNWSHPFELLRYSERAGDEGGHVKVWKHVRGLASFGAVAAAMVGAILTSDAWYNITFIAGEVKNPKRNVGLSLFLGTLIVSVLYVLCNLMYLAVLPIGKVPGDLGSIAFAPENRVAIAAALKIFGNTGTLVVAFLIMLSAFGCNNGLIISGARVFYAMAKDGLFFKKIARLNKNAVPENGLWIQCLVAILLCTSGRYGDLFDYISFVVMAFYIITVAGIFILRKKQPDLPRDYKAFGYPYLTVIYILVAAVFCVSLIVYKPQFAARGLFIVLLGIPIYYFALARQTVKD
ncbi:APC family permease [Pedobacter sp. MC2016-24]|uniref:APC family permease n=1 Tax=Pedobacter sp. MC2016-24 TaxID=2780090 RepID=UPI00187DDEF9|nr:amino acid permease [Pedobacter sp. MC2016-24]MBE9601749.1 amino acid permease [Pedobacter sp. MC2016-24]